MIATGLIDTGVIVALLNPKDGWHERCVEVFRAQRLPLATTGAVCTEVFHLLKRLPNGVELAWQLLHTGAVAVLPISDDDKPELERLMLKYRDCPMDFADATLVRVAARESLTRLLTIDHNDFETYRIGSKTRFRILPAR